jgi:hypothetical protein
MEKVSTENLVKKQLEEEIRASLGKAFRRSNLSAEERRAARETSMNVMEKNFGEMAKDVTSAKDLMFLGRKMENIGFRRKNIIEFRAGDLEVEIQKVNAAYSSIRITLIVNNPNWGIKLYDEKKYPPTEKIKDGVIWEPWELHGPIRIEGDSMYIRTITGSHSIKILRDNKIEVSDEGYLTLEGAKKALELANQLTSTSSIKLKQISWLEIYLKEIEVVTKQLAKLSSADLLDFYKDLDTRLRMGKMIDR